MEAAYGEGDQVTRSTRKGHEVECLDFAHDQPELHEGAQKLPETNTVDQALVVSNG